MAVGRTTLLIAYHLLAHVGNVYRELDGLYFEEHDRQAVERRLVKRCERLGYTVTLSCTAA